MDRCVELEKLIESLEGVKNSLQKELKEAKDTIDSVGAKYRSAQYLAEDRGKSIATLVDKNEELIKRADTAERSAEMWRKNYECKRSELNARDETVSSLRAQIGELSKLAEDRLTEIKRLSARCTSLGDAARSYEGELEELKRKVRGQNYPCKNCVHCADVAQFVREVKDELKNIKDTDLNWNDPDPFEDMDLQAGGPSLSLEDAQKLYLDVDLEDKSYEEWCHTPWPEDRDVDSSNRLQLMEWGFRDGFKAGAASKSVGPKGACVLVNKQLLDQLFEQARKNREWELKAKNLHTENHQLNERLNRAQARTLYEIEQPAQESVRAQIADYLEHCSKVEVGTILNASGREIVEWCSSWVRNKLDEKWREEMRNNQPEGGSEDA